MLSGMTMESLSDAKRRLLDWMKRSGAAKVKGMARALDLTEVAVRQHLQSLECAGLVVQVKQPPKGRGRPSVLWSLTADAEAFFPDRHAELTVGLIGAMREAFGKEGLDRLVQIRGRGQLEQYRQIVPDPEAPLAERLDALARQRTREGYMAEVEANEDGSYTLIEHHCPICSAARLCSGLCSGELQLFRNVLGDDVEVERIQHLLSDSDRCAYLVRPSDADPKR